MTQKEPPSAKQVLLFDDVRRCEKLLLHVYPVA